MGRLRVPIAGLMAGVALVALDAAMIRSMLNSDYNIPTSPTTSFSLLGFALGVIPMANLLLILAVMHVPRLLRRGEAASFLVGFEVFGWAAVFLFITACTLSPPAVVGYANGIAAPLARVWHLTGPEWFFDVLEVVLIVTIFGLPELTLALLGGWLTRRAGIRVRIERQGACNIPTEPAPAAGGSVGTLVAAR